MLLVDCKTEGLVIGTILYARTHIIPLQKAVQVTYDTLSLDAHGTNQKTRRIATAKARLTLHIRKFKIN